MVYLILKMFWFTSLWASGPQEVMRTQSLNDLNSTMRHWELLEGHASNCDLELQKKWFPRNCLLWMSEVASLGKAFEITPQFYLRVSHGCRAHISELSEIAEIENYLSPQIASSECIQALQQRKGDLVYQRHREFGPDIVLIQSHEPAQGQKSLLSN